MSTATRRLCAYPRCGVPVAAGRCAKHRLTEADRPNVDIRKWYRTPRWRALRAQVLAECYECPACRAEGRRVPTSDVDHVRPHRGDPALFWDKANLQALCHRHHSAKTGRGE